MISINVYTIIIFIVVEVRSTDQQISNATLSTPIQGNQTTNDHWIWGFVDSTSKPEKNVSETDSRVNLQGPSSNDKPQDPCDRKKLVMPDYSAPGKRIAEQKCEEYLWTVKSKLEEERLDDYCKNGQPQVVTIAGGGRDAEPGEFPHMGAIGWKAVVATQGPWIYKCGSILISPKFVLTAAHCSKASDRDSEIEDVIPKIIRFGATVIDERLHFDSVPVMRNISKIIVHPDYKSPKKYNDIALMELHEDVEFGRNIQPACLWHHFDTKLLGSEATATGWGVMKYYSRDLSPILQVVTLDSIDSKTCTELLKNHCNRLWCGVQDTQICAGKLAGGVDTCQGDSGGPLQVKIPLDWDLGGAMHYVIGVVSFGFGCLQENTPGIYTRVSAFVDWIEGHVWKQ
ncbi:trypsin domain-containing protein [Phthorimaea operculella]|nr:trypsin domain-containing protein [Phthorimaea operculella]